MTLAEVDPQAIVLVPGRFERTRGGSINFAERRIEKEEKKEKAPRNTVLRRAGPKIFYLFVRKFRVAAVDDLISAKARCVLDDVPFGNEDGRIIHARL